MSSKTRIKNSRRLGHRLLFFYFFDRLEFVEKELLPDAAETMNALSEAEKTAVSLLLKAYILSLIHISDGICRVSDSHYTKTIQFQDINYQLSQNEDKTAIFE